MTTAVSIRKQAAHEGVSSTLIHRWRKRGMPADLEGGSIWRKRHTARRTPAPRPPAPPETADTEARELSERPEAIVIGEAACEETLLALRRAVRHCEAKVRACDADGNDQLGRQWTQTFQMLAARQTALEERLRDILERDGKTMSYDAAELTYRRVLTDIRQKLLSAPAALAAQLNPSDPLHAQSVMEGWLKILFKSIYEGQA